ncbi:MAG TPA: c-type cytochrome [Steroidobacteraceae bacterium]|jgi:cytochrome c553|nr:c-type cytochrome [Steroidobacteraceae bacterium]
MGFYGVMKRLWILAATISGILVSTAALPAPSVEAGATKAATCQACHGANGNSTNPEWPSLAGLGADYIAEQLNNFKTGKRASPVMMPMTVNLTTNDMADLGMYFDSLTNTGLEADPSYWQAGERLYRGGDQARGIPACMACHGATGKGNEPAKFPALRGQQSGYVVKQLKDYASGTRTTGPNGIMQTIAKRLSADDIRNLASYLQGIR